MSQDLIQKAAELVVDMKEMADLHAGNGDTPAAEEFSQGAEVVRQLAVEADRYRFFMAVATNEAFVEALDPFMAWAADVEASTAELMAEHTDRCIQVARDNGLWPIKPEPELTDEAQADRDDFESYKDESGGCRCHLNPPCGYCTHPGNPANQEDPSCWKVLP